MEALEVLAVDTVSRRFARHLRQFADLFGHHRRDRARNRRPDTCFTVLSARILKHRLEHSELDPVGVRLDLLRLAGQLVRSPEETRVSRPWGTRT